MADSDGDGLPDGEEDRNGNGLVDVDETSPLLLDTDGGGEGDGLEVAAGRNPLSPFDDAHDGRDLDEDGLADAEKTEIEMGLLIGETDPMQADTDGDGLSDGIEVAGPTDPLHPDSDRDGLLDGIEDLDSNGLTVGRRRPIHSGPTPTSTVFPMESRTATAMVDEMETKRAPCCPTMAMVSPTAWRTPTWMAFETLRRRIPEADTDEDGLADGLEDRNGNGRVDHGETDPRSADTDGDGLPDGVEDANRDGV